MADQEQLSILKQGVDVWNKWREENPDVIIDLNDAYLFGMDLSRFNLQMVNFIGANLGVAKLCGANLRRADLRATDLSDADIRWADFSNSDLSRADLRRAYLNGANLKNAYMGFTIFGDSDLSEAMGVEEVRHESPSTIGMNVLQLSKGKIPITFLRGCGLSDLDIEYAKLYNPDLTNHEIDEILYRIHDLRAHQAIQVSPLFISYSRKDGAFVDRLEVLLNEKGIRFWRDIHDATSGRLERQIEQAIRHNPTVLLVLSENALQSDWVQHEVRQARGLEKELGRDVLCPVALDASWKDGHWPQRIMEQVMEYNILDFSQWQDEKAFGKIFVKLLDGLQLFYKG